jgi:hypothetical protein
MGLNRAVLAIAAVGIAITPAAHAARSNVRVTTLAGDLVAQTVSGAARSVVDGAGTPHALPADTALGQLAAVTATADVSLLVEYSAFGAYVSGIGRLAYGNAYWELFVDNAPSEVGAADVTIAPTHELVWLLNPDFNGPDPTFLDLDRTRSSGGRVTVRVTRSGKAPAPAAGATVRINGRAYRADHAGVVRARVHGAWSARATLAGSAASERLTGTA